MRPDHGARILGDFNKSYYPGYTLYGRLKNLAEIRGMECAAGHEFEIELAPGRIGVSLSPVKKGVAVGPLPPETGVEFDFSALAGYAAAETLLVVEAHPPASAEAVAGARAVLVQAGFQV